MPREVQTGFGAGRAWGSGGRCVCLSHGSPLLTHLCLLFLLAQTNCVDATIANLLEGRVPFTPGEAEVDDALLGPSGSGVQQSGASCPAMVHAGRGVGGDVWQGAILRGTNETFWPVSMAQSVRLLPLCIFCAHAQVPVKVFARSSEARHLSLQERKQALYDYARR